MAWCSSGRCGGGLRLLPRSDAAQANSESCSREAAVRELWPAAEGLERNLLRSPGAGLFWSWAGSSQPEPHHAQEKLRSRCLLRSFRSLGGIWPAPCFFAVATGSQLKDPAAIPFARDQLWVEGFFQVISSK